jgi:uncharacterized protein YdhG (YjbR/CyaY superfamily)
MKPGDEVRIVVLEVEDGDAPHDVRPPLRFVPRLSAPVFAAIAAKQAEQRPAATESQLASVDDYIAGHSEPVRAVLELVRNAICGAIPLAEERMGPQMPLYRFNEEPVISFFSSDRHFSIYPTTARLMQEFRRDLERYEVERGCIRFPLAEAVPLELIERIAKFRAREVRRESRRRSPARASR